MDFNLLGKAASVVNNPKEAKIDTFENKYQERDYLIQFECVDFTSLCPVTGQADFAEIEIQYIPKEQCIETKSLKYYLQAFRNVQAFNEQIVNTILNDLVEACQPKWFKVKGAFAARGGIKLTAIAEFPNLTKDEN